MAPFYSAAAVRAGLTLLGRQLKIGSLSFCQSHLPRDGKDRALKWLLQILKAASFKSLGVNVPRPSEALSPEVLQLDIRRSSTDALFRAEDGSILHVEFQMANAPSDMRRFMVYDAAIVDRFPEAQEVHTVVLYGPRARQVASERSFGSISYQVHAVYLGHLDGEARLAVLLEKVEKGERLEQDDILILALTPLMGHQRPLWQMIKDAQPILESIPSDARSPVLGAMVTLGYAYTPETERHKLWEVLNVMSIGQEFFDDMTRIGERKGEARGRIHAVLEVVEVRFGPVPDELRSKIELATDVDLLAKWHSIALRAKDLKEFEKAILG